MKKFRSFKLILLTLFVFKILLTSSFANYDLENESKLWETLDKNLKEKKQEEQRQKEQEEQRLKQAQEEQRLKEQEEQKLKQEQEEQRQKEEREAKTLLSKLFPKNKTSIIVKVNNEIITNYDLEVEINYLMALNPNLKTLTPKKQINLAKDSIVREKIKLIEILKYYEFGHDTNYIDKIIADTYNKLGLKNEFEFKNYLSNYDLTMDDIKKKIEIEVVWNKLIFKKHNKQVEIDIEEIKKKLNKQQTESKKQEIFLLSEILFNAENKKKLNKKYKKILESIVEIGFKNTANIYSISDSAKFGGSIGWIQQNQLSEVIINELSKISVGEFTNAINIPGGMLIIKINEKKIKELKTNFDLELKKMIQFEKNKQLGHFSSIYFKKIKNNIEINEN